MSTPQCCKEEAEYKQFQNFAYWFCQQCKKEVSEAREPEQAYEENTSFDFGMNVPGDYASPLYVYSIGNLPSDYVTLNPDPPDDSSSDTLTILCSNPLNIRIPNETI